MARDSFVFLLHKVKWVQPSTSKGTEDNVWKEQKEEKKNVHSTLAM